MMEWTGELKDVSKDFMSGKWQITFTMNEPSVLNVVDMLKDKKLRIEAKQYREKRSLNANGLLWVCLGKMAEVLNTDKWEVYLQMLRRYGQFTYICVKPSAVESVKAQWRECEELGEININGSKAVQMLCYFGSSTYDKKEFARLLDGVVDEMKTLGLQPPESEEMKRCIEEWEKVNHA